MSGSVELLKGGPPVLKQGGFRQSQEYHVMVDGKQSTVDKLLCCLFERVNVLEGASAALDFVVTISDADNTYIIGADAETVVWDDSSAQVLATLPDVDEKVGEYLLLRADGAGTNGAVFTCVGTDVLNQANNTIITFAGATADEFILLKAAAAGQWQVIAHTGAVFS